MRTVIYHGDDCPDGFTAAWAAWERWAYDGTTYLPLVHDETFVWDPYIEGREVWILDCCFPRETLLRFASMAASIQVLDHHITAAKACGDLPYCYFDMNRSGAGITWDWLHTRERPWIINYVEDRDLWTWKLPDAEAVCYGLDLEPREFPVWSRLAHNGYEDTLQNGQAVKRHVGRQLKRLDSRVKLATFGGYEDVAIINSPILQSELGHRMLVTYPHAPFAVVWHQVPSGKYRVSFRSEDERVDVSEVARSLGGGGHRNASGATIDYQP